MSLELLGLPSFFVAFVFEQHGGLYSWQPEINVQFPSVTASKA
jgi:hypothetical protein